MKSEMYFILYWIKFC